MKVAAYILSLFAIYAVMQRQDAADVQYTKNLETTLAQCLSDGTGRPVVIEKEVYLCGIVATGVKF